MHLQITRRAIGGALSSGVCRRNARGIYQVGGGFYGLYFPKNP